MEFYIIGLLIGLILGRDSTSVDPAVAAQNQAYAQQLSDFVRAHAVDVLFGMAVVLAVCLAIVMGIRMVRPPYRR